VSEIAGSKKDTYSLMADYFNRQAENANKSLRILCKISVSYKFVPAIMIKIIRDVLVKNHGLIRLNFQVKSKESYRYDSMSLF